LGRSYPFLIHEGSLAAFARSYALGLYQQRCGTAISLPYTRHTHHICHAAPAEVPTMDFAVTQQFLAEATADYSTNPRHTAPQLKDVDSSLYPFERQGLVDVSGGHHDAGDYSKYTINSAQLIHHLVFAADNFPGAGGLDNLGWPESGDGRSDLLQAAKWEADFLAKMQDTDGGFYFLVYPRNRRYEDNVLPDRGDPQVVWPKTTAVTAAAVAALAEIGSSPRFKREFPESAALYLEKAALGWEFIEKAIATHGQDGSYQKITHYGNEFMHDDELAWAAAAMFGATGDDSFHEQLKTWFPNPADRGTHRWSWWRMFEGYGCAVRSYAFAVRSGRLPAGSLDLDYLTQCEAEIVITADEQAGYAKDHAYGSSFALPYKIHRNAGWHFSSERAFDLTVAYQLEPKPEYLEAVLSNLNYEGGCNPLNRPFITGLGWPRQREIVHQHAQNDWQVLPPSGLPQGNIQGGFPWLHHYQGELSNLVYPPLNAATDPFPFYDRWADTFNTTTEFTVVDQARSLASLAFWMAMSGLGNQPWQAAPGRITGVPAEIPAGELVTAHFDANGLDLEYTLITWEARDQQPQFGTTLHFTPANMGEQWVEVEAQLPDGRRVFARTTFAATTPLDYPPNGFQSVSLEPNEHTVALFHLDGDLADATGRNPDLTLEGAAALNSSNLGWTSDRSGAALRVEDLGDRGLLSIPGPTVYSGNEDEITIEAMIFIEEWKAWQRSPALILSLQKNWNAFLQLVEDPYKGLLVRGYGWEFSGQALSDALPKNQWRHISISLKPDGYSFRVDGQTLAAHSGAGTEIELWNNNVPVQLELGNFRGWIDEVVLWNGPRPTAPEPGSGRARFLGTDTLTQGSWKGVYGTDGYDIIGHSAAYPLDALVTPQDHEQIVWAQSSREIRALERVNGRWRFAGAWRAPETFTLNLRLTNDERRRVTFYFLDWDSHTRSQRIDVLDAIHGEILDTRTVAEFRQGQYLQWEIEGEVIFRFTGLNGTSPVLSALFFDPVP
jgi:hypothetical protein